MDIKIEIPTPKKLHKNAERWSIQNEIFALLGQDYALKRENWRRFIAWLKKDRRLYTGSDRNGKMLENRFKREKLPQNEKYIQPIYKTGHKNEKATLGVWTSHLDNEALYYVLSVCKDRVRRDESPTSYIYSLNKQVVPDLHKK